MMYVSKKLNMPRNQNASSSVKQLQVKVRQTDSNSKFCLKKKKKSIEDFGDT